ncbi:MAG: hypothetical protein FK730_13275 [Asgard group archaeon]|nr:hypothetical protein [Asgard group archaeon]
MDEKELAMKLLEFFKIKYRGAGGFRISNVKSELMQDDIEIYSFNLRCSYKREPYNLDYFIKFYKKSQGIIKTQFDLHGVRKASSGDPYIRFVGDKEFFGYPYQIIDKKKDSLLKNIID